MAAFTQVIPFIDHDGQLYGEWASWRPTADQTKRFGNRVPNFIVPPNAQGGPAALLFRDPTNRGLWQFSGGPFVGQHFFAYMSREGDGAWND